MGYIEANKHFLEVQRVKAFYFERWNTKKNPENWRKYLRWTHLANRAYSIVQAQWKLTH